MKKILPLALTLGLSLTLTTAAARPLTIANDAWRAATLADLAPALRACVPKPEHLALPRLPLAKGATDDLDSKQLLQEPASIGQGYWYRLGWRAKDGTLYVVALRSPDGQRSVFGPVDGSWSCLPAEIRKELH